MKLDVGSHTHTHTHTHTHLLKWRHQIQWCFKQNKCRHTTRAASSVYMYIWVVGEGCDSRGSICYIQLKLVTQMCQHTVGASTCALRRTLYSLFYNNSFIQEVIISPKKYQLYLFAFMVSIDSYLSIICATLWLQKQHGVVQHPPWLGNSISGSLSVISLHKPVKLRITESHPLSGPWVTLSAVNTSLYTSVFHHFCGQDILGGGLMVAQWHTGAILSIAPPLTLYDN